MDPPILTEPIRPTRLPRIAAPVGGVLPFDERRVNRAAAHRGLQDSLDVLRPTQYDLAMDPHYPALLPLLADRRVQKARHGTPLGQQPRTTGLTLHPRDDFAEGRGDCRLVGRVFVAGDQLGGLTTEATLEFAHDLVAVLGDACPGDHR